MSVKVLLREDEIPRQWYNLAADLPTPMLPPLGPDGNPVNAEALAPVFPMNLIEQEVSQQRWIDIPSQDPCQDLFQERGCITRRQP
jgi:tryptophan synthase beta chain